MPPLDFNAPTAEQRTETQRRKAAITRRIRKEVLAEHGLDTLPRQGERTLVTGAQGTGKSRTCAETIAELPCSDAVIWWLVPTLAKAEEQVSEYTRLAGPESMQARVVRGRGAPDPRTDGEAMCPRHPVVNRAAAMGVNVQEAICDDGCALRFTCGFQRQRTALRQDPTGLFVMANDYLWVPCPAPRPDLAIVDESVIAKAGEIVSFDPSRITADDLWAGGDPEEAMRRRHLAILIRAAVTEHPRRELVFLREHDVTVDAVRYSLSHLATREEAQPHLDGRMSDKTIASILDAIETREILKVMNLFRQIRRELPQPRARLNSVWFDPDARVKVNGETERAPRVFVGHVKTPRLRKETPILALDGTGSLDLNQRIFGEHMTGKRFAVPRDAVVIQCSSKIFSRQSLTGTDRRGNPISAQKTREATRLRRQVLELLRLVRGEVLLVTYKAAEEILQPDLPPNVAVAHFGALRGLNSFERCETAVVMGREQPSAQAIEWLTRPFTATDAEPFLPLGEYVPQLRGRRMRHGGPNVAEVQVHPDPRCQAMLEQVREAEIAQAIDRVRPIFNRRRIIILTSLALDITVDRALPWVELRPGKFAHAFARHGVLPLSAGDLAKAFPDLWHLENTAKVELRRSRLIGYKPQIDRLFGICILFSDTHIATYRRQGQRGSAARALVRADLHNPRAVLEDLVGELVGFEIDRPPDPPTEAAAPESLRPRQPLPPLAAALAAEAHLLGTMPPASRPPDMLGMAGVLRVMGLGGDQDRAEWKAAA